MLIFTLLDMVKARLTGTPTTSSQVVQTVNTARKLHEIGKQEPAARDYCFDRGLVTGSIGIADTLSFDQINKFRADKDRLPTLTDRANELFDKNFAKDRNIDPKKFTEDQEMACLVGDFGGSMISSLATPAGLLAGFKAASKLEKAGKIAQNTDRTSGY